MRTIEALEKAKELKPTNDYIFKRIYGRKGSERITEKFIKAFLDLDVKIKEIYEEKNLETMMFEEKGGALDVLVETEDGTQIDIEMQVGNHDFIADRLTRYACKLFALGLHKGELYSKTRRTIVAMFITDELESIKDLPKHIFTWHFREKDYANLILTENLEIDIISLSKIKEKVESGEIDAKEKFALWTKFLLNPKEMKVDEMEENEEIKEANEKYEEVIMDLGEMNRAIRREEFLHDIVSIRYEGKEEGLEEGAKEAKIEIAKNLLKEKVDIELIIKVTGLTKEEIEKLK